MNHRTRPRRRALVALLLASACSPGATSPSTPVPTPPVAVAASDPPAPPTAFRWPFQEGWYRLEVAVEVPAGVAPAQRAHATSMVRWSASVIEIVVEATDPTVPSPPARRERTVVDPAATELAALRARFEQARADGLVDEGIGEWGGRRFRATHTGPDGTVVAQTWEIGTGPAPWSPGR